MDPLPIAIVVGSTREGRFADKPVQWIAALGARRSDLRFETLDLRDFPLPFFDEPDSPFAKPPARPQALRWASALARFDGYLFVTPEYNHGPPAVLKNAIDYAGREWLRKPAAFVGYGGVGAARAIQALRLTATTLRMAPIGKAVHITQREYNEVAAGKSFDDFPPLVQAAGVMFDELAWWARALREARSRDA